MDMSMPTVSMTMSMSPSMTTAASASTSSATPMSGMGMGMGGSNACKISMLWNWYTVNSCFISSTWKVTSNGMFAGSCIGVVCLVISLEFLRRLQREYDQYIIRRLEHQHISTSSSYIVTTSGSSSEAETSGDTKTGNVHQSVARKLTPWRGSPKRGRGARASVYQQLVRAFIHLLQFAVAYFIMLLAMYYNGYIIISILVGAFIGNFIFSWEGMANSGSTDATGCCG